MVMGESERGVAVKALFISTRCDLQHVLCSSHSKKGSKTMNPTTMQGRL
jgi:hypothetical protein